MASQEPVAKRGSTLGQEPNAGSTLTALRGRFESADSAHSTSRAASALADATGAHTIRRSTQQKTTGGGEYLDREAKAQLAVLGDEKREEEESLRKMCQSLSDAVGQEQKAQQLVEKQQSLMNFHKNRCASVESEISKLSAQLKQQERKCWDNMHFKDQSMLSRRAARQRGSMAMTFGPGYSESDTASLQQTDPHGYPRSHSSPTFDRQRLHGKSSGIEDEKAMAVVEDVVSSRIVEDGPQVPTTSGSMNTTGQSWRSKSSGGSNKPVTHFRRHGASTIEKGPGSPARRRISSPSTKEKKIVKVAPNSRGSMGSMMDWFEEEQQRDERLADFMNDSSSSWTDNDSLYMEISNGAVSSPAKRRQTEMKVQAGIKNEVRNNMMRVREEAMDAEALNRKKARERRMEAQYREDLMDAMVFNAGTPWEAFRALDVNKSGRVSLNEFDGGMRTLGIKFEEITGINRIATVFRLFDQQKKGHLTFADVFPFDAKNEEPNRMSTPRFWEHWCSKNKEVMSNAASSAPMRHAKWEAPHPEAKLDLIGKSRQKKKEVDDQKKWMKGMIHRLKFRGKSDARCREIAALHLPRGTGPRDLQDVNTFSQAEVQHCRKTYTDKVQESVRNIEKTVFDMHDQRKKLHNVKQHLSQHTEEPHLRAKMEEAARLSLIGGLMGGATGGIFKKGHDDDAE